MELRPEQKESRIGISVGFPNEEERAKDGKNLRARFYWKVAEESPTSVVRTNKDAETYFAERTSKLDPAKITDIKAGPPEYKSLHVYLDNNIVLFLSKDQASDFAKRFLELDLNEYVVFYLATEVREKDGGLNPTLGMYQGEKQIKNLYTKDGKKEYTNMEGVVKAMPKPEDYTLPDGKVAWPQFFEAQWDALTVQVLYKWATRTLPTPEQEAQTKPEAPTSPEPKEGEDFSEIPF